MNQNEQYLADELEQIIQAAEANGPTNGPTTPQQLSPEEAKLAVALIDLAKNRQADPTFVADLRAQLQMRAVELEKQKKDNSLERPSLRPSFWRDLQQMLKEGFTMKRSYALGAIAAFILFVGTFALWQASLRGATTGEVAAVATVPVETVADEGTAVPVSETATGQPLTQLPRFNAPQAPGMGGGGGDSATSEMPLPETAVGDEKLSMMMADPFSGTTFILNTTLPVDIINGAVLQRTGEEELDVAVVQQLASQYGFTGPVYVETYTSDVPVGEDGPPTTYIAFDGPRTLRFDPWSINYSDEAAAANMDYENPLPFEQSGPIAEAFLTQRGQLNFPYVMESSGYGDVFFKRLVDGRVVNEPEIVVSINQDGQVVFLYDNVTTDWQNIGSYPTITAEAAWQRVLAGVSANNIQFGILPAETGEQPIPVEEPAYMADYQYWPRERVAGSETHLYEWVQVYRPVDGGTPLIKVRQYTIQADDATLNALADGRDNQLHLWGRMSDDGTRLELAGWEPMGEYNPIFKQGVVRRQGDQLIFYGQEGDIYILPDAQAEIPDGLAVNVFGYGVRDTGLEFPVLDWESVETYIEYPEPIVEEAVTVEPYPAEGEVDIMPIEPFVPFHFEQVQIDGATLVYYITYLYPEMSEGMDMARRVSPTIFVQPAWKFTGTADSGERIELFVQAVADEYLQP